jgi:hypothetical protein
MTEQAEPNDVQITHIDQVKGIVGKIQADEVVVDNSIVGSISAGECAHLNNNIVLAVAVGQNAEMTQGISAAMAVGHNLDIKGGGGGILNAGQNINIHGGGGGLMICKQAEVEQSTIGVLLANQATLGENVTVLMTTPQAIALGAAMGLVAAVFGILFRRRR